MPEIPQTYDIAVIGGGAAGMMAAGRAAERGLSVILLEKNAELGKKLLITGGGRCNITNAEYDVHAFLGKLGKTGQFLYSTFAQFGVKDTFDFFESKGLPLKVEDLKRAFPADDKSESVLKVLALRLRKVHIRTKAKVAGFVASKTTNIGSAPAIFPAEPIAGGTGNPQSGAVPFGDSFGGAGSIAGADAGVNATLNRISGVKLSNGEVIHADHFILATGGNSHPETGSTGDAYAWLKEIGHEVITPELSLVPIAIQEQWVKDLQGVTLDKVKLSLFQEGKKIMTKKGRLLFTHFGISGPTVINMSRDVGEALKWAPVEIQVDLFPELDYAMMNKKLQELFEANKNRLFKNAILEMIPGKLAPTITKMAGINPETEINSVTREERLKLIEVMKHLSMNVDFLLGPEKSIVTSGGVACEEVDYKTMRSRLYPNLLFAGDILNIERPSGGYSLQICWSTGWVAASAIEKIAR